MRTSQYSAACYLTCTPCLLPVAGTLKPIPVSAFGTHVKCMPTHMCILEILVSAEWLSVQL